MKTLFRTAVFVLLSPILAVVGSLFLFALFFEYFEAKDAGREPILNKMKGLS